MKCEIVIVSTIILDLLHPEAELPEIIEDIDDDPAFFFMRVEEHPWMLKYEVDSVTHVVNGESNESSRTYRCATTVRS